MVSSSSASSTRTQGLLPEADQPSLYSLLARSNELPRVPAFLQAPQNRVVDRRQQEEGRAARQPPQDEEDQRGRLARVLQDALDVLDEDDLGNDALSLEEQQHQHPMQGLMGGGADLLLPHRRHQ